MPSVTSEKGLETIKVRPLTGLDGMAVAPGVSAEASPAYRVGYIAGSPKDFDRHRRTAQGNRR